MKINSLLLGFGDGLSLLGCGEKQGMMVYALVHSSYRGPLLSPRPLYSKERSMGKEASILDVDPQPPSSLPTTAAQPAILTVALQGSRRQNHQPSFPQSLGLKAST